MFPAPTPVSPNNSECIVILFDLTSPEAVEELHHLRAVWQGDSDIECLEEDHFALVIRPGWASEAAA